MNTIEYVPGDTIIHRLDPRAKTILILFLTIAIFAIRNFFIIAGILLFVLFSWRLAGIPLSRMKTFFKFMTGLAVFLVIVQGLFFGSRILFAPIIPDFIPGIGGIGSVKVDGILFGLLLSLRLFTLITLLPIVTMTTPVHLLTLGLTRMGLNYKISYLITSALNLVPTLQTEAITIMEAQKMRGMKVFESGTIKDKFKAYPALAVPLVIGAMQKAQLMGVAMDARAFGAYKDRTYIEDIKMDTKDWVVMVGGLITVLALIIMNFWLGLDWI